LSKISGDLTADFGKSADLNAELIRQRRVLEKLIAFAIQERKSHLLDFVRVNYNPRLDVLNFREPVFRIDSKSGLKLDFFEQFENYMRLKESWLGTMVDWRVGFCEGCAGKIGCFSLSFILFSTSAIFIVRNPQ